LRIDATSKSSGVERATQLGFRGVYRVGPDAQHPVLLIDDFAQPNGLTARRTP